MSSFAPLRYLTFDYSEDDHGHGTFDAMASVTPHQAAVVQAEMAAVLTWAECEFAGVRSPLDDGGDWDAEAQAVQEVATPLALAYDTVHRQWHTRPGTPGVPRLTYTLTITGTAAFCDALRERFALDADT